MKRVRDCYPEKRPTVLGLTATLLNANVKDATIDVDEQLNELERIFDGKIVTSKKCHEIRERYDYRISS
jgi:hypothetical protein